MADSITTQADIRTQVIITDNELRRLETIRDKYSEWSDLHEVAWSFVKNEWLALRNPPLEETDLYGGGTQLKRAVICLVLYFAYQSAEMLSDEDKARRKYWFRRARKAYATTNLQDASGSEYYGREAYGTRVARRG